MYQGWAEPLPEDVLQQKYGPTGPFKTTVSASALWKGYPKGKCKGWGATRKQSENCPELLAVCSRDTAVFEDVREPCTLLVDQLKVWGPREVDVAWGRRLLERVHVVLPTLVILRVSENSVTGYSVIPPYWWYSCKAKTLNKGGVDTMMEAALLTKQKHTGRTDTRNYHKMADERRDGTASIEDGIGTGNYVYRKL